MEEMNSSRWVLESLMEPGAFGGKPEHWEEAMAALPAGLPPFLDPAALPGRRAAVGLPSARDSVLLEMAERVAKDPALLRYAWYLYWFMFPVPVRGVPWGAPSLEKRLGRQSGLFYELIALEFFPRLALWHRKAGYPESVTVETARQVALFDDNHMRGEGVPGVYPRQFVWLAVYFENPYVRLGRFEFALTTHYGANAWKRLRDGRVLALADDGLRVAEDGLCLPADAPAQEGWSTRLEEQEDGARGYPVDPAGHVIRKKVYLDAREWVPCLRKGDQVLDLHIPAGGGMGWEAVTASFAQALEFFARHHSDKPFQALVCRTWFLDGRLCQILPPGANILQFQRMVYLVPIPPDRGGLWFVFLRDTSNADPDTLPCDTALQKTLVEFLRTRGGWNGGAMFLLKEHMKSLREDVYREGFPALRADLGF